MGEHVLFFVVGFAIGAALAVAVGQSFVQEHGRKALPGVVVGAILTGLVVGWGVMAWDAFQTASATLPF